MEQGTLEIVDGVIAAIHPGGESGPNVLPGFVDVHCHGGVGSDVMDATPEALHQIARFYARHGVTGFLATTMTAPPEHILRAVRNAACCGPTGGARILGVHLEGPFLNPEFPGAQGVESIRLADPEEVEELFSLGNIRMITVAPEMGEANLQLVHYAVARDCAVAVGHTGATYEDVLAAARLGANQATHTFNGMRHMHHREPGTVGAVLAIDELFAQIIVDFVHVHPAIVKTLVRCKGVNKTLLITDAMRAAGCPDGDYEIGGHPVEVHQGIATLKGHAETLAGSTLTMDQGLRNLMECTGLSLAEAFPMSSTRPALSIGLKHELSVGCPADLVLVDDHVNVAATMVGGHWVYRAG